MSAGDVELLAEALDEFRSLAVETFRDDTDVSASWLEHIDGAVAALARIRKALRELPAEVSADQFATLAAEHSSPQETFRDE